MTQKIESQIQRLDEMMSELKSALAHAETAKSHFKNLEIPRACAHTFATQGHLSVATELLEEISRDHSKSARA